jgi:hypothetical protein
MYARQSFFQALLTLASCAAATSALAVSPVMDGTVDALYGSPLSVQTTKTHFGDNDLGDLVATRNGGSEIDRIFAVVADGRLHVMVAGNLQNNFNKLEIYIDSVAGGVHEINGSALPSGVDPFSGGALQRQHGLIFDAGFDADHYLTFTHGGENLAGVGTFWALTAHYADLTQGTAGQTAAAGMQLAPKGLPQVLRGPLEPDFDNDFDVDGSDFLTWQRNLGTTPADKLIGDANNDDVVNGGDLTIWRDRFATERTLTDPPYNPSPDAIPTVQLLGPTLPSLTQGALIDKNYVASNNVAPELAFADAANRNMENTIDLRMALDNSNIAGVEGTGEAPWLTAGNPGSVTTGIEFSIPLSQIGNPTGDIKITAFVNGDGHNYASNQFTGVGIQERNPGGDGIGGLTGDLTGVILDDTLHNPGGNVFAYLGDQFVTLDNTPALPAAGTVPEPATAMLGILAALGVTAVARRS